MKRITSLLFALFVTGVAANAQSTMPQYGAETPKGQVAKTAASVNPTDAQTNSNTSAKTKKTATKRTHKMKMTKNRPVGTM